MERISITEHLTKGFYNYLRDSSTSGGSQPAKIPLPDTVSYEVLGYKIETKFTDKHQCKLTITGNLKLEELVSVPYNESSEKPSPNWEDFYKGIFILIRERS